MIRRHLGAVVTAVLLASALAVIGVEGWFAVAWLGEKNTFYALGAIGFGVILFLVVKLIRQRRNRALVAAE